MRRRIVVLLSALSISLFHVIQDMDPFYLFFFIPFAFLLAFYFFILEDRFCAVTVLCGSGFLIVFGVQQTHNLAYFLLVFISALVSGAIFLNRFGWDREIQAVEHKKQSMFKEVRALQERYQIRMESLKHLQGRVDSLVRLFEIARHFNECLNFTDLFSVVDQKISQELSFARGTLILLSENPQGTQQVERGFTFGHKKRLGEDSFAPFANECLNALSPTHQPIRFEVGNQEQKARFSMYNVQFPFWLFPLLIERQLIAIVAIEGSAENDFQKFEVLASQLALQVKKIRLYETMKENSIVDDLTRVFVRRHFLERFREELKRAFRYNFPLSVLMVDVDHFKSYNDKFGHLVGDKTLKEVAQVIRENVRKVDVIGRYGGEEFVIVAPEISKSQGVELAERIRSAVARKKLTLFDEETQITVSIGVSSFPEDLENTQRREFSEANLSLLVERADQALYIAKDEGRNRVVAHG